MHFLLSPSKAFPERNGAVTLPAILPPETKHELSHHLRAFRSEATTSEWSPENTRFRFDLIYFYNTYRIHFVF